MNESRVNLHHDTESFSKASLYIYIFFYGYDRDRSNAVRLFRVISEDSVERDSLDESSAF